MQIKGFLTLKNIASLDDLETGDIALFNGELIFKKIDGTIRRLITEVSSTQEYEIFKIYGVRLYNKKYVVSSLERVFIERKVYKDGHYVDDISYGDDHYYGFSIADGNINVGEFSDVYPFSNYRINNDVIYNNKVYEDGFPKDFVEMEYPTEESDPYGYMNQKNNYFVGLPVFFKRIEVEELDEENNEFYVTYLMSEIKFDGFYPVESHIMTTGKQANYIYIEADWRQQIMSKNIALPNGDNSPIGEHFIINEKIFYAYLYYVYTIMTCSFEPFSEIDQSKHSIFISDSSTKSNWAGYDGYENNWDIQYNIVQNGGDYYVRVFDNNQNGTIKPFFDSLFFSDVKYCIHCVMHLSSTHTNINYIACMNCRKLESYTNYILFKIEKILPIRGRKNYYDLNYIDFLYLDAFFEEENAAIDISDIVIKTIVQDNIYLEENTYDERGFFNINGLYNLLPVYFNAMFPMTTKNTFISQLKSAEETSDFSNVINYYEPEVDLRLSILENYKTIIDFGNNDQCIRRNRNTVDGTDSYFQMSYPINSMCFTIQRSVGIEDSRKIIPSKSLEIDEDSEKTKFVPTDDDWTYPKNKNVYNITKEAYGDKESICLAYFGYIPSFDESVSIIAGLEIENMPTSSIKISNCYKCFKPSYIYNVSPYEFKLDETGEAGHVSFFWKKEGYYSTVEDVYYNGFFVCDFNFNQEQQNMILEGHSPFEFGMFGNSIFVSRLCYFSD